MARKNKAMTPPWFYILNFTWGLPMNLIGFVALLLLLPFKRPYKYGPCLHIEIGRGWGGVNFGLIFITQKNASERLKMHEVGHAVQNAMYGFLMPFIVGIPSVLWWTYMRYREHYIRVWNSVKYDDIWFERDATWYGVELVSDYFI